MLFEGTGQVMLHVSVNPLPLEIYEICLQKQSYSDCFIFCSLLSQSQDMTGVTHKHPQIPVSFCQ